jgi:alpha-ketoglutaric semialdehyde dehydrogenase
MLSPDIHAAYERGAAELMAHPQLTAVARGVEATVKHGGRAALFTTIAADLKQHLEIAHEIFRPSSVVVRTKNEAELVAAVEQLEDQLGATLHMTSADLALAKRLLPVLERQAGRVLANDWPTGIEVTQAMVHGRPFPATSDARSMSVGLSRSNAPAALCDQDLREELLSDELRGNTAGRLRLLNGELRL